MADDAARQVAGSYRSWTGFLETAARLYKYPFNEQLMIYAQRPDAVACTEYDFWNDRMRRYVSRGSKGIALINTSGDNPRLRYVFDVSDTGGRKNSIPVWRWHYWEEYVDTVSAALERAYDVSGENGLATQLEQIASRLAGEFWNTNARDIIDIIDDSFLEEYDDFNIGAGFRNAATVSLTYSLLSRCELEPGNYFEHEDFLSIFDFNTPATVCALGTAVSEINQEVLREIEATIRNYSAPAAQKGWKAMSELTYTKNGDYEISDLSLTEQPQMPLGKYGRKRKNYLKEQRPVLWNRMLLSETLYPHLREIDETANRRLEQLMPEQMKQNGVMEELKARDPMKWTGLMNKLKAQAEETILTELVFN